MEAIVKRDDLGRLLALAATRDELWVPLRAPGGGRFVAYSSLAAPRLEDLALTGEATGRPAKEALYPQTETLLSFRLERGDFALDEPPPPGPARVLFGVRPCDGRGFLCLDRQLLRSDFREPGYDQARRSALLIGVGCSLPGQDCFCTSTGGDPHSTAGLDVLLTDLGAALHAEALTEAGVAWLEDLRHTDDGPLRAVTDAERAQCALARLSARRRVPRSIDMEELPGILERAFEGDVWRDLVPACIGCGACTYLCPTCRCFDVQDEVHDDHGQRLRVWDSCMFAEYSREAGGHNPRPRQWQRWRNRFYDKMLWSNDVDGAPACVGCGRCIGQCPAGVDLLELAERVIAEEGGP